MKKIIFKSLMMALLVAGAGFGFSSCTKDSTLIGEVVGEYAGKMQVIDTPVEESKEAAAPETGTDVNLTVTADAVEFAEFPVRSLVAKILNLPEDSETVDGILALVGPVSYSLPYTAAVSADKQSVDLTLLPEVLNLNLEGLFSIAVTISAGPDSAYDIESKNLEFELFIDQIQLGDGEPFSVPFSLAFDMVKE